MASSESKKKLTSAEFREQAAHKIIDLLKQGTAPWQLPFVRGTGLPHNPVTALNSKESNGRYRGGNFLLLQAIAMIEGYNDPRWVTFNQASRMRRGTMQPLSEKEIAHNKSLPFTHPDRIPTWQIRKGEHGTMIEKWGQWKPKDSKCSDPTIAPVGEAKDTTERSRLFFQPFWVFNAAQIDGVPEYRPLGMSWSDDERYANAAAVIEATGSTVRLGDRACYVPGLDVIEMPTKGAFKNGDQYWATLLHEHGHWSGHQTRLNREGITGNHAYGSEEYAKEELRAEIASMILAEETGVPNDPTRHAAYVGSWVKVLQNDPNEIFAAARDANKITDFILAFKYKLDINEPELHEPVEPVLAVPEIPCVAEPAFALSGGL